MEGEERRYVCLSCVTYVPVVHVLWHTYCRRREGTAGYSLYAYAWGEMSNQARQVIAIGIGVRGAEVHVCRVSCVSYVSVMYVLVSWGGGMGARDVGYVYVHAFIRFLFFENRRKPHHSKGEETFGR